MNIYLVTFEVDYNLFCGGTRCRPIKARTEQEAERKLRNLILPRVKKAFPNCVFNSGDIDIWKVEKVIAECQG